KLITPAPLADNPVMGCATPPVVPHPTNPVALASWEAVTLELGPAKKEPASASFTVVFAALLLGLASVMRDNFSKYRTVAPLMVRFPQTYSLSWASLDAPGST